MNVFNRLFTVISLLFLTILGTATLISPAFVLTLAQSIADSVRTNVFGSMTDIARFGVRMLAAIIFCLIMLGVLWLELRRPSQRTIEVGKFNGGTTIRISTDAVESKIRDAVDNLSGVIGSKVKATTHSKAVDVHVDVLATKDSDLVAKAEEIAAIARMIVQDQLGLKLHSKPQVTIKAGAGKARIDRKPLVPARSAKSPEPAASAAATEALPAPVDADLPAVVENAAEDVQIERKRSELFTRHLAEPKTSEP